MTKKAARHGQGRPPIPEHEVQRLKEAYLNMLGLGKTEIAISELGHSVSLARRQNVSVRRLEAQA